MKLLRRLIARTWLAVFLILAGWFAVKYFSENGDSLARIAAADKRYLVAATFAQILYYFATVKTWQYCLRYSTQKNIGFREGLSQILLLNVGKYIPGKIWGLAARGARLKELGFSIEQAGTASYLEQVLLIFTGFWLAFAAAAAVYQDAMFLLPVVLTTVVIFSLPRGGDLLSRLSRSIPGARRLEKLFKVEAKSQQILALSLGYLAIWLFLTLAFILLSTAIVDIELIPHNGATFLLSLTSGFLAGFFAIFAPGGVGVREGVGALFLTPMVQLEEAVMIMLLYRVWIIIWELVAGAAFWLSGFHLRLSKSDSGIG